jgi:outer membrane protein assembly factor BamB
MESRLYFRQWRPRPHAPEWQRRRDSDAGNPQRRNPGAFNPETGELLRQERLKDAIGDYYASPVAADGKIYFVNKEGKVTVISAGANWKPLSSGDLDAQVIAAPAIAASRIYIRTDASLYCFAAKPPA